MVGVRLVRQKGVREEPASERSSRQPSGWRLADRGRAATRTLTAMLCVVTLWLVDVAGREAMRLETERGNHSPGSLTGWCVADRQVRSVAG